MPLVAAVIILLLVAAAIAPKSRTAAVSQVTFDEVRAVVVSRCTGCHAETPTFAAFPAPPAGVILETDQQILAEATRIHQQTVVTKAMPIANLTRMSEEERQIIDAWYQDIEP